VALKNVLNVIQPSGQNESAKNMYVMTKHFQTGLEIFA